MRLWLTALLFLPFLIKGQPCSNIPGMNPITAIPVCGTTSFFQNTVATCTAPTLPSSVCTGNVTSNNSFWYKFHCYQSGSLAFLITPINSSDDYDWVLFDITGYFPSAVYAFESVRMSMNLSGQPGPTGCTPAGSGNLHCEGGPVGSQYSGMPFLTAGNDYLLMVTNFLNTGTGYLLNFNGTSAVITNSVPPDISQVLATCGSDKLKINFSKDILCSSVTASGSEFTIMPGNISVASITSQCTTGFNATTQLIANLPVSLVPGNYTLVVNNGTDGNTFKDVCGDQVPAGLQIPFSMTAQAPATVSNITYTGCAPAVLDVRLSKPVLCSSITPGGSEFSIIPGNPSIISLQSPDCNNGNVYTNLLRVTLQNPLPYGIYNLLLQNGTDGNTFIDTCSTAMAAHSTRFIISQTTAPVIQSIDFNECQPKKLLLNFDKLISCSSVTAAGSEFIINPGNIPATAAAVNCTNGNTSQISLTLQNQLPAGNFSVNVNNGTDANTISDTCFSFMAAGYSKSFVTTQSAAPLFDSVVRDICNPAFVKVYYNKALKCNSISADGSDYFITGPSPVSITGASGNTNSCGQDYTNWVLLQFAQPVNVSGTYILHNRVGSDADGIIDTCSAAQSVAETISFFTFTKPSPVFNSQVLWGCVNDTIRLSHPGGNGVNSWTWKFSDGSSSTGQNVSHLFPVSTVAATVKLIVTNSQCTDSIAVDIALNNGFNAAFSVNPADTSCMGKPVTYTNNSTGANLNYLWEFGDNSSFNGNAAPAHIYAANNTYAIRLIATDNQGCRDTATHSIVITPFPIIDFGVLNPQYCTSQTISLRAMMQGNIGTYTWDNGDGKTFTDQAQVNFNYINESSYTVKLSATDRFCGLTEKMRTTQIYLVPVIKLGNDTTFCPGSSSTIGVPKNTTYTYLWNNGATNSLIVTGQLTYNYVLTADNNGCKGMDAQFVKVLSSCLIKIPNAFTPNNDGLNDYLKAVNADLAGKFSLSVYNRLGQKVFATNDPMQGWDGNYKGQPAETGTYVWQVSFIDPLSGKAVYEKGTSILIR